MKLILNTNINYRAIRNIKGQLEVLNHTRTTLTKINLLHLIKSNQLNYNLNNTNNLINDVLLNRSGYTYTTPYISGIGQLSSAIIPTTICTQNTLFFKDTNQITIPKKMTYVIQKFVSHKLLREIHSDLNVAREYCLLFLMQLNSAYYNTEDPNEEDWKSLNAGYLREFFTTYSLCYKKIIDALLTPTSKGVLIECDGIFIKGHKNYYYKLGANYKGKGYTNYTLQTEQAKQLLQKYYQKKWDNTQQNIICKNLIEFYKSVTLPTLYEIENEATKLISQKYKTKKGKPLKRLNKHRKSYFRDSSKYCFVEDSILIFNNLTENGIMIPITGGDASGGRVVDSFTLMPSWIRNLVKIKGKPITECDYSCFHPNIAALLYGGNSRYLTHKHIEKTLGIDEVLIKTEHLSFFNKDVWQMKLSPLYDYYIKYEKWMLNNIIDEKRNDSQHKYKITSRRLFKMEVVIMTKVIQILNREKIYVGYVYDALFFNPMHAERVKEVMDNVAFNQKIYTKAKLSK